MFMASQKCLSGRTLANRDLFAGVARPDGCWYSGVIGFVSYQSWIQIPRGRHVGCNCPQPDAFYSVAPTSALLKSQAREGCYGLSEVPVWTVRRTLANSDLCAWITRPDGLLVR